jgi:hypothetical protein
MIQHLEIKMKILLCLFLSIAASPIAYVIDYYSGIICDNKKFIVLVFSAFLVDVACGIWKHLKAKDFSFRELMTKAMTKIAISFLAMVLFNALAGMEGIDESGIKVYLLMIGKLMNLIYLSGSAFNNIYFITEGKFPPIAWMNRMKNFNETLNPEKITQDSK